MFRKVLPLILVVVASATAYADKVSGFVSGKPSGKTFVLGAKGGPYNIDASKARVTLDGKFFSVSNLTGGSQVTVEGTKKGKSIMATTVVVGNLKGAKKPPTTAGTKKPAAVIKKPATPASGHETGGKSTTMAGGMKAGTTKPKSNSKSKSTAKTMSGEKATTTGTTKAGTTTKTKADSTKTKAGTTSKTKENSKSKSTAKAKSGDKTKTKASTGGN